MPRHKVNLTWRADADLAAALKRAADEAGVGPSTMVRMIVIKYFKNQMRKQKAQQRSTP